MASKKIVVLGMGGTIAGSSSAAGDNVGYRAGSVPIGALLANVPSGGDGAPWELVAEQVAQIDSKDLSNQEWQLLFQRCQYHLDDVSVAGVVITHGTDTFEETGFFLAQVLASTKPVVLTCAMRPATSAQADGPQNLRDALTVACDPQARGVLAVWAGHIAQADRLVKVQPYRIDAFEVREGGHRGVIEEGRVRWWGSATDALAQAQAQAQLPTPLGAWPAAAQWPVVDIVMSHAGARAGLLDAVARSGVHGIVVAATGNGTVHEALLSGLDRIRAQGIAVVVASRCLRGAVVRSTVAERTPYDDLTPVQARIRLMLALMRRS